MTIMIAIIRTLGSSHEIGFREGRPAEDPTGNLSVRYTNYGLLRTYSVHGSYMHRGDWQGRPQPLPISIQAFKPSISQAPSPQALSVPASCAYA